MLNKAEMAKEYLSQLDFDTHKVKIIAANGMRRHFSKRDGVSRKTLEMKNPNMRWDILQKKHPDYYMCLALLTHVQVNLLVSGQASNLFLRNQACLNFSSDHPGDTLVLWSQIWQCFSPLSPWPQQLMVANLVCSKNCGNTVNGWNLKQPPGMYETYK